VRRSAPPRPADARAGPAGGGRLWSWAAGLALAGAAVSGYLTITGLQGAPPVCLAGDCAAVAASPYARFLGVPTAAWGLGLFFVAAALAALVAHGRVMRFDAPLAFFGLTVFAVAFSAYLFWVQAAVLRAVCSWCVASDLLWVALAIAGAAGLRTR
jgi:uncharacterized membrane protein